MCTPGAPKLMLNCAAAGRARKHARTLAARMDLRMMDLSIEAPAWAASAAASVRWRTGRELRHGRVTRHHAAIASARASRRRDREPGPRPGHARTRRGPAPAG